MQVLTRFNKVIAYNENGYVPVGGSAVCVATNECYCDALIVEVDCVPTDIDMYDYYYIDGKFVKGGTKPRLNESKNTVMVTEVGPSRPYVRGELNYTVCGSTVHIYGDLSLEPKVHSDTPENRVLYLEDGGNGFAAPPATLTFFQPLTRSSTYDEGGPSKDVTYATLENNMLTILELPASEYIINHTIHINIVYNALGVKGVV